MSSNAKLALVIGGVVLVSIIAIAMMKQNSNSSSYPQTATQPGSPGTAPQVDPNLPEWARTAVGLINSAGQVGVSAYTAKTQADLQRRAMAGYEKAPRMAGYSHSISA